MMLAADLARCLLSVLVKPPGFPALADDGGMIE